MDEIVYKLYDTLQSALSSLVCDGFGEFFLWHVA